MAGINECVSVLSERITFCQSIRICIHCYLLEVVPKGPIRTGTILDYVKCAKSVQLFLGIIITNPGESQPLQGKNPCNGLLPVQYSELTLLEVPDVYTSWWPHDKLVSACNCTINHVHVRIQQWSYWAVELVIPWHTNKLQHYTLYIFTLYIFKKKFYGNI